MICLDRTLVFVSYGFEDLFVKLLGPFRILRVIKVEVAKFLKEPVKKVQEDEVKDAVRLQAQ